MRTTKLAILALIGIIPMVLWGCGSSRDSGGSTTGDQTLATAQTVGINTCVSNLCHDVGTNAVTDWLDSGHANPEGFPGVGYFGDAASCTPCHDQTGDSANLVEDGLFADISLAERPVVGCESCHGGGQFHFGIIGGIPFASPDYDRCGQCHNETFDHNTHHPFADSIVENYKAGAHINSIEAAHATPDSINPRCGRCHSDEGFRRFYDATAGFTRDQLSAFFDTVPNLTDVNPVQCRTCHDSHTGELWVGAETDPANGAVVYSDQFKTCTACHNVFIDATFDAAAGKYDYALDPVALAEDLDGTRNNHYHGFFVDMVQSHFDNPDTAEIEGYNINGADENACLNCHDAHAASKFEQPFASGIANEWAIEPGFHGDYKVEAFNHGFDEGDAECMECHNGTEAVKVIEGLEPADLDGQPARVVGCVTCHDLTAKSADGTMFELGERREFKEDGAVTTIHTFPSGMTVDMADSPDNMLCLNCHSGRNGGSSVDAQIAANDTDGDGIADGGGTFRFQNIHYRAAGASLFGNMAAGGYEFEGKVYASKFEHVDSNDLCVECHNAHDGKLFIVSPGFGPTGCAGCHGNITADPATDYAGAVDQVRDIRMNGSLADYDGNGLTEGIYYEVQNLKNRLLQAITESGATFSTGYPYFGNLTHAAQLQAAYNYQVVDKDPGSYAHNGDYIIQLLYDSLEAMAAEFNGTAGFTDIVMANYVREDSGHFDSTAEAFRHWDGDGEVSTSCARCHSSEGAAAFFTFGDVTEADFKSYTGGIAAGLACEACHNAPFNGTLRSTTSVEFPSGVVVDATTPGAAALFAAGNDSPLCMSCHQGRSSTDTVDARIAAGNLGFTNIHYYAAAASFFGNTVRGGYQYAGQTYAGTMTFPAAHDGDGFNTCEGCHMDGTPTHDFAPLLADCTRCHGGTSFETLGIGVGQNLTDITTLKDQLAGLLTTSGVTFLPGYPYFSNITTEAQLKAAYNWQFIDKEPCGYIHNPDYVTQILFDAVTDMGGTPAVARP